MLKKIAITNYRSCFSTSFELRPDLSVLIGPNGSGKTNVLQAIMLLNRMVQQQERYHQSTVPAITSRLRFQFQVGHTQARLLASVEVQTDDSNKDIVTNSRQKWQFNRDKRESCKSDIPLAIAARLGIQQAIVVSPADLRRIRMHYAWSTMRQFVTSADMPEWAQSAMKKVPVRYRFSKAR